MKEEKTPKCSFCGKRGWYHKTMNLKLAELLCDEDYKNLKKILEAHLNGLRRVAIRKHQGKRVDG